MTARGARPAAGDPLDRRGQLRCISGVTDLDSVVEDHPVGVVDDLGFVAELHGLAQPSLPDRSSIDVMKLTTRLAESGITPASRLRVWATTRRV